MNKIDKMLNFNLMDDQEIPKISLYMDQVTGFLDEVFYDLKRNDEEKILTKTMINNYVKAGLLKSPDKKKYSKTQIKALMMIYMLKNTIQIQEIDELLKHETNISSLYEEFKIMDDQVRQDIKNKASEENKINEIIKLLLSANAQKKYAEMLLDELNEK